MHIIYGYDVSYTEALKSANINSLSQRRSELCQSFFQQTISNAFHSINFIPVFRVTQFPPIA